MALPSSGTLGANLIMAEFGFPANTRWAMSTDGAAWISFTVGSQIAQSDFYGASAGLQPPFAWRSVGSPVMEAYQWTATLFGGNPQVYTPDNNTGTGVTQPSASKSSQIYNSLRHTGPSTWQQETGFDWVGNPTAQMTAARGWSNTNWRWDQFPDPNASLTVGVLGAVYYTSGPENVNWSGPYAAVSSSSTPVVSAPGTNGGIERQGWHTCTLSPGVPMPKTSYPAAQGDPNFAFRKWNVPWTAHPDRPANVPTNGDCFLGFGGTASVTRNAFGSSFECFIEFKFD